ncbi:cAMP-dependent protein kinase [Besnoitia besnoiti]|uniref:non-specific serine/threonine protein kinase n=1 Tax=Besnoitia besnoiti TaxID=94643 RepID=A0A2A9MG60_BESBE|nr:cAMP-dependent protein kinase [Besnoitia besnoiti]PFH36975.1 cAMP-dependent protein kinase [Besnoitia besnoiti]
MPLASPSSLRAWLRTPVVLVVPIALLSLLCVRGSTQPHQCDSDTHFLHLRLTPQKSSLTFKCAQPRPKLRPDDPEQNRACRDSRCTDFVSLSDAFVTISDAAEEAGEGAYKLELKNQVNPKPQTIYFNCAADTAGAGVGVPGLFRGMELENSGICIIQVALWGETKEPEVVSECKEEGAEVSHTAEIKKETDVAAFTCGDNGTLSPANFEEAFDGSCGDEPGELKKHLETGTLAESPYQEGKPMYTLSLTQLPESPAKVCYKCTYPPKPLRSPPLDAGKTCTVKVNVAPREEVEAPDVEELPPGTNTSSPTDSTYPSTSTFINPCRRKTTYSPTCEARVYHYTRCAVVEGVRTANGQPPTPFPVREYPQKSTMDKEDDTKWLAFCMRVEEQEQGGTPWFCSEVASPPAPAVSRSHPEADFHAPAAFGPPTVQLLRVEEERGCYTCGIDRLHPPDDQYSWLIAESSSGLQTSELHVPRSRHFRGDLDLGKRLSHQCMSGHSGDKTGQQSGEGHNEQERTSSLRLGRVTSEAVVPEQCKCGESNQTETRNVQAAEVTLRSKQKNHPYQEQPLCQQGGQRRCIDFDPATSAGDIHVVHRQGEINRRIPCRQDILSSADQNQRSFFDVKKPLGMAALTAKSSMMRGSKENLGEGDVQAQIGCKMRMFAEFVTERKKRDEERVDRQETVCAIVDLAAKLGEGSKKQEQKEGENSRLEGHAVPGESERLPGKITRESLNSNTPSEHPRLRSDKAHRSSFTTASPVRSLNPSLPQEPQEREHPQLTAVSQGDRETGTSGGDQQQVRGRFEKNVSGGLGTEGEKACRLSQYISALRAAQTAWLRAQRERVDTRRFRALKVLGIGAYGVVRLVEDRQTGEKFALKQMEKGAVKRKNERTRLYAERHVLAEVVSRHIVKLVCTFQDKHYLYQVLEYLPGGDLMTHLVACGQFSEQTTKFYIAQLILAVHTVHKLGYLHRDIKPCNIVLDEKGNLKLLDFGLCAHYHSASQVSSAPRGELAEALSRAHRHIQPTEDRAARKEGMTRSSGTPAACELFVKEEERGGNARRQDSPPSVSAEANARSPAAPDGSRTERKPCEARQAPCPPVTETLDSPSPNMGTSSSCIRLCPSAASEPSRTPQLADSCKPQTSPVPASARLVPCPTSESLEVKSPSESLPERNRLCCNCFAPSPERHAYVAANGTSENAPPATSPTQPGSALQSSITCGGERDAGLPVRPSETTSSRVTDVPAPSHDVPHPPSVPVETTQDTALISCKSRNESLPTATGTRAASCSSLPASPECSSCPYSSSCEPALCTTPDGAESAPLPHVLEPVAQLSSLGSAVGVRDVPSMRSSIPSSRCATFPACVVASCSPAASATVAPDSNSVGQHPQACGVIPPDVGELPGAEAASPKVNAQPSGTTGSKKTYSAPVSALSEKEAAANACSSPLSSDSSHGPSAPDRPSPGCSAAEHISPPSPPENPLLSCCSAGLASPAPPCAASEPQSSAPAITESPCTTLRQPRKEEGNGILSKPTQCQSACPPSANDDQSCEPPATSSSLGSSPTHISRFEALSQVGTPHYMAPEVLSGLPYSFSADWWSVGVILFECIYGGVPFNTPSYNPQLLSYIIINFRRFLSLPQYAGGKKSQVSPACQAVIQGLLCEQEHRWGFEQLRKSEWLRDVDWDALSRGVWKKRERRTSKDEAGRSGPAGEAGDSSEERETNNGKSRTDTVTQYRKQTAQVTVTSDAQEIQTPISANAPSRQVERIDSASQASQKVPGTAPMSPCSDTVDGNMPEKEIPGEPALGGRKPHSVTSALQVNGPLTATCSRGTSNETNSLIHSFGLVATEEEGDYEEVTEGPLKLPSTAIEMIYSPAAVYGIRNWGKGPPALPSCCRYTPAMAGCQTVSAERDASLDCKLRRNPATRAETKQFPEEDRECCRKDLRVNQGMRCQPDKDTSSGNREGRTRDQRARPRTAAERFKKDCKSALHMGADSSDVAADKTARVAQGFRALCGEAEACYGEALKPAGVAGSQYAADVGDWLPLEPFRPKDEVLKDLRFLNFTFKCAEKDREAEVHELERKIRDIAVEEYDTPCATDALKVESETKRSRRGTRSRT